MSYRKPSYRTLLVVNTETREIVAQRKEDSNTSVAARITKDIYDLVKSGRGIMYFVHKPNEIRLPVEINGRFFAKPAKYTLGCKPGAKVAQAAPVAPATPKIRKFVSLTWEPNVSHVEYDGKLFIVVNKDGTRTRCYLWTSDYVEKWLANGTLKEITVAPATPKVRKFFYPGWEVIGHPIAYVEYDGDKFTTVAQSGVRSRCCWTIKEVEKWLKKGEIKELDK